MTAQALLPSSVDDLPADSSQVRRHWWSAHRFALIAYGLPVTVAVLATLRWFSWGRFVAFLDIPPSIHDSLSGELTSLWSHQTTGAGSTSVPILQLVEVVLGRGVGWIGLPAPVAQWLLYALCFGLCAFGAAYLAATWVHRAWAAAAAGLLATFNTYLLVWLPILLPALAIGLGGLLAGMVVRVAMGRRINPLAFAAATLPASYLALNPPWLLMTVLTVFFAVVGSIIVRDWTALRRVLSMLGRALPWIVLFNLWWAVPLLIQLASPAGTAFGAVIDVRDASSIQDRATVKNVVTLSAHWAWNAKGILIYARALSSGLRVYLHWVLPLLALAGALLAGRRRRRAAWLVAGVGLALIFLSTGVRSARFGWVNLWLYDHVPGMWLIRDPAGKLGAPIVLMYASLAALAIDRMADLSPRLVHASLIQRIPRSWRVSPSVVSAAPRLAIAGVVLAALAYPSPMWTGKAIPDAPHNGLPSARVAIPASWHRLADTVNAEPGTGKVIVLPVNLYFYAFQTTWGYSGVDVVPSQLVKRPTLHLTPGGYFQDLPSVVATLVGAQNDLLAGNTGEWQGSLRALGVDTVIVRHDLQPASPIANSPLSADPVALDAALGRIGGMRSDGHFGVASLYHVAEPTGAASVGSGLTGVYGQDTALLADAIAGQPPGSVGVTDPNQPVDAFRAAMVDPGTVPFTLGTGGSFRVDRSGFDATYRVGLAENRLTLSDADTVAVDGRSLPTRPPLQLNLDAPQGGATPNVVGLDVDGSLRLLRPAGDTVVVGPHTKLTAYAVQPGDGLSGPFRRAEDCDGVSAGQPNTNPLRLSVASGQQCAVAPVRPTAGAVYRVHFTFRDEGGAKARVCLWQDGPADCALLPSPPAASGWAEYTAITRLSPDTLSARLYLYADASAGDGVAEFRDVALTPLRAVGSALLSPSPSTATNLDLSKGHHTVTVNRYAPAPTNDLAEFSNCTLGEVLYPRYPTGNRQPVQPDGSVSVDAPKRRVCAEAAGVSVVPGAVYRFSADYRSDYGQTARICVREDPSERCADIPGLTRSTQWQTVRALVRPDFGTTMIRPQVNAGETELVPSHATYRNIELNRVSMVSVSVTRAGTSSPKGTTVTSVAVSPSHYRLVVHGAAGPFALVLRDSYAPGWSLDGLPAGWSARHLTVDGYANGWLVEGTGDAVLTARYGPQRWASAALTISLIAGAVAIALVVGRLMSRNDQWRARLARLRRNAT